MSKKKTRNTGRKAGGLRFDLIPPDALAELAYVYTAGAEKYEDRNWEGGYEYHKSLRALHSHAAYATVGQERDPETDAYHWAQVAWHAIALLTFTIRGIGENDLPYDEAAIAALDEVRNRSIPKVKKYRGR